MHKNLKEKGLYTVYKVNFPNGKIYVGVKFVYLEREVSHS